MRNDRGNVECRFVAGNLWWQVDKCGVSEITIHSLRSNWPGARREGGSVSAAILDRLSKRSLRPISAQPEGRHVFWAEALLLAPHRSTSRYALVPVRKHLAPSLRPKSIAANV